MSVRRFRKAWLGVGLLALAGLAAAWVVWINQAGEAPLGPDATSDTPAQVQRGAYLARVGNCMACHTAVGGAAYAGGRGIETPFGVVFSSNLTAHPEHGLGGWTRDAFWRAMHHGRSRDGRLLYPAFPYTDYTRITREDSDALLAFLRTVPAAETPRRAHALRFPYSTQAALAVWRALYFRPAEHMPDPTQSADWNRGAYLVQGLGHCAACHAPRNALGATQAPERLGGGLIPVQNWYAPALNREDEGGLQHWTEADVVALLRTGVAPGASVIGPMAEVVFRSTQYLSDEDARAMAVYLQALPPEGEARPKPVAPPAAVMARGAKVYEAQCAQCHGSDGRGEPGAFAALAGNRAVLLHDPTNVVRMLLLGGYPPATAGHPRPHGMPPFQQVLGDEDIAAVASFVRNSWGNQAPGVGTMEVYRARERRGL
ncbi:MAG: c-type cytochrome [Burkholderiaceae bacterium]